MSNAYNDLHVQVEDQHGAVASVYTFLDGNSKIVYHDANGHKFFEEDYAKFPIETVERHAVAWATGKRQLAPIK